MSEKVFEKEKFPWEEGIRPSRLDEFIGQDKLKDSLKIYIEAAKKRGEHLDHTILYGPPGLGKTTLSKIIANELGVNIKFLTGPSIEKQGDLASILTTVKNRDLIFIDEIHRLHPSVEEILYSAMEDYYIDIIIGKGRAAKTMRLNLPKFTLVGATTRIGLLTNPLVSRFGITLHLDFYSSEDLKKIVLRSARILKIEINERAAAMIAKRSRGTPRRANILLKRVRDVAEVKNIKIIDEDITEKAFEILNIDKEGLDSLDRKILTTIINNFEGGPVGIKTLASAVNEEKDTIEDVYEPYLIREGFLEITSRGRRVTKKAYEHLGLNAFERRLF